ncbi:hypothetical protein [Providencia stuartii]|uniref:hypothetical protein n=1 Tax=Providencia stuartii TaxID=588 RepID=UPI003347056C
MSNKKFKGTPAPWKITDESNPTATHEYHYIASGNGFHDTRTNTGFELSGFMSIHDANLIAAAPELLKSLGELVSTMERYEIGVGESAPVKHKKMMKKAKSVIAKATGTK